MNNRIYAGFWWRWLAHFIDALILSFPNALVGFVIGIAIGFVGAASGLDKTTLKFICSLSGFSLGIIGQWLYFALMESSPHQASVGKKICKLMVTDMEGQRLTFARASGRYWAKWISTLTCLIGYILAAFTERKQALHDMIANTLVFRQTD